MDFPWIDTAPSGVETPTPLTGCCLAEVHAASARRWLPSGQRRGPAPPGEDNASSRTINLSIPPQFQQTGDENDDPTGRYRPARCGNPNPIGWLLIDWGWWNQCTSRVAPRANVEVAPLTGRILYHPRIRNPLISLQLQRTRDHEGDPTGRYRPTWCGNPKLGYTIVGWGSRCQRTKPNGCKEFTKSINRHRMCTPTTCC